MRTRVALDPDTEHLIRQRMKDKGVSFKRALNDVIREGAGAPGRAAVCRLTHSGCFIWNRCSRRGGG